MSVRVLLAIQSGATDTIEHTDARSFVHENNGSLILVGNYSEIVARYAPGCWASATKLPDPEPATSKPAAGPGWPWAKVTVVVEDRDGKAVTYTADDPETVDVSISFDPLPDGDENGWAKFRPSPLAHFDVRVVAPEVDRLVTTPDGADRLGPPREPTP